MNEASAALGLVVLVTILPFILYLVFALVGRAREQRHLAELEVREAAVRHVVVTDLRSPSLDAADGHLVTGSTVVASDWGKQFVAQFKKLVGGELRSYQSLLSRARREARLRMIEEAINDGSTEIHNVRYLTSTIGSQAATNAGMAVVEILCFGTAIRR